MNVKKKLILASCLCILLGSNILTFAITRVNTTALVKNELRSQLEEAVESQTLLFQNDEEKTMSQINLVISEAGGRYSWSNEAVLFYAIGTFLVGAGVFMPLVKKTRVE